jgi:hypothetical protein
MNLLPLFLKLKNVFYLFGVCFYVMLSSLDWTTLLVKQLVPDMSHIVAFAP